MEQEKIAVEELQVGMYVADLDRPWLGTPFLFQGFPIRTEEEIAQLRALCRHVVIDRSQSSTLPPRGQGAQQGITRFDTARLNTEEAAAPSPPQDAASFTHEVKAAQQIYSQAKGYIDNLFHDLRLGHGVDADGARHFTHAMAESIVRNESAMLWLSQLRSRDEYTSCHSLNVCILSLIFARAVGLPEGQIRDIGFGALLHDIGKMRVPLELLNKPARLTPAERQVLNRHPEYGYEMLQGVEGIAPMALEVVRHHHERADGSGYPLGLRGDGIGVAAQIAAIVDVYDAITSDRAYHDAISPHEALSKMYDWAPAAYPRSMLEQFIRCLGIFPIGSLVELESGEVGVVMTVNRRRHLKPLLTLVLNAEKKPYDNYLLINLETHERAGSGAAIRRILGSHSYGIDVRGVIAHSQGHMGLQ